MFTVYTYIGLYDTRKYRYIYINEENYIHEFTFPLFIDIFHTCITHKLRKIYNLKYWLQQCLTLYYLFYKYQQPFEIKFCNLTPYD